MSPVALWVGCYTQDMGGAGSGVVALRHDGGGGYTPLGPASPADSPSFLALHPTLPVVYAAAEGAGAVVAHAHDGQGRLQRVGEPVAVGSLACHVAVDPGGAFLVACCWGDGTVAVVELSPDGSLGRVHVGAASHDPHSHGRQSRAHASLMLGNGQFVTSDIGHDVLRLWRFCGEAGLELTATERLPFGCGPRHFAHSSRGVVYVVTEYTAQLAMLYPVPHGPGMVALELQAMLPTSQRGLQDGDAAAEVCLHPDERHMYVGIRGSNRICTLAVGDDGHATPIAETDCGGDWPRNHCLHEGRLLVALERSSAIAVFELGDDGLPAQPPRLVPLGSPTHVLAARQPISDRIREPR